MRMTYRQFMLLIKVARNLVSQKKEPYLYKKIIIDFSTLKKPQKSVNDIIKKTSIKFNHFNI